MFKSLRIVFTAYGTLCRVCGIRNRRNSTIRFVASCLTMQRYSAVLTIQRSLGKSSILRFFNGPASFDGTRLSPCFCSMVLDRQQTAKRLRFVHQFRYLISLYSYRNYYRALHFQDDFLCSLIIERRAHFIFSFISYTI